MNRDKQQPEEWNEFDWERELRSSDEYAQRYFQLLERFNDLPGADELISSFLGAEVDDVFGCEYDCEECEHRWECSDNIFEGLDDSFEEQQYMSGLEEEMEEGDESVEGLSENGGSIEFDEELFFERDPRFESLRRVSHGWCNLYAAVLPPKARHDGLKVLFHLGRGMGNLSCGLGEEGQEFSAASIAFTKRALAHINLSLGLMRRLMQGHPRLAPLLGALRRHLLNARGGIFDHLQKCRGENGS